MIDSFGALLLEFMRAEQRRLDEYEMSHGPTIGDMYEGLSKNLVERALPMKLGLRVVSGFVTDGLGGRSRQIDCMLVSGEGAEIPYTHDFTWHIRDVIAILEIKKSAYSADIADAIPVLQSVKDCQSRYLDQVRSDEHTIDIDSARYAFGQATKRVAPSYEDLGDLPFSLQLVFHSLVMEQLSPVFIVLGYGGFRSEQGFREGLLGIVESALTDPPTRLGVASFPQLIVSGEFSAVKANGQPYIGPVNGGVWEFMLTTRENPAILMLELIWTRLQLLYNLADPWGEDLETQVLHRFLGAKAVQVDDLTGWEFHYAGPLRDEIAIKTRAAWRPATISAVEAAVLAVIFERGFVSLHDKELLGRIEADGATPDRVRTALLATDLVAFEGDKLVSIARQPMMAVLGDGTIVAGENNTGRLSRWLNQQGIEPR